MLTANHRNPHSLSEELLLEIIFLPESTGCISFWNVSLCDGLKTHTFFCTQLAKQSRSLHQPSSSFLSFIISLDFVICALDYLILKQNNNFILNWKTDTQCSSLRCRTLLEIHQLGGDSHSHLLFETYKLPIHLMNTVLIYIWVSFITKITCSIKSDMLDYQRRAILMMLNLEELFITAVVEHLFLSVVYHENTALR